MKETTRKQRTPAEIIAETEAKLARLRVREAKKAASDNPEVAPLLEERAERVKALREAKKLLGSGPQSAEARIAKHEAWIERIRYEVADADAAEEKQQRAIVELDQRIEEIVSKIANQASA